MADVPQAIAEKPKPATGADNSAPGFNLVDLAAPGATDKQPTRQPAVPKASETPVPRASEVVTLPVVDPPFHLTPPAPDADLNHRFVLLDPNAWDNTAALRKIYENGVVKLMADPNGKQQFGIRISDQKTDHIGTMPLRGGHFSDKGVSLEFRLKF